MHRPIVTPIANPPGTRSLPKEVWIVFTGEGAMVAACDADCDEPDCVQDLERTATKIGGWCAKYVIVPRVPRTAPRKVRK